MSSNRIRKGQKVRFRGRVYTVTGVRIGRDAYELGPDCDYNPRVRLPDYIELDGELQVHPSQVRLL